MDINQYFKAIVDSDRVQIVICDLNHTIIYMNKAACSDYAKHGNLIGKSIKACHNSNSGMLIDKVIDWMKKDKNNNYVHTFYNEKKNKDVYMVALRDDNGNLIGYYEKHEFRTRDESKLYELN